MNNISYNAYELERARIQYMERKNQERLAKIALAGREKSNPIGTVMKTFRRIAQRRASFHHQNSPTHEVILPVTNA